MPIITWIAERNVISGGIIPLMAAESHCSQLDLARSDSLWLSEEQWTAKITFHEYINRALACTKAAVALDECCRVVLVAFFALYHANMRLRIADSFCSRKVHSMPVLVVGFDSLEHGLCGWYEFHIRLVQGHGHNLKKPDLAEHTKLIQAFAPTISSIQMAHSPEQLLASREDMPAAWYENLSPCKSWHATRMTKAITDASCQ